MSNLILGKFALENLYYSTLPVGGMHECREGRWCNGTLNNGRIGACAHQRLVDDHVNEDGTKTGCLVCRECGEVIHKPVEA